MPEISVVMGSDSDWKFMEAACRTLRELEISFEVNALSAHRTPDALREHVLGARGRGVLVFIAAAGGAAHLPGVIAAHTVLPVIGVPIPTNTAGGLDSLLSIAQMPSGVPVATMSSGSGGPANAALLAAQILALSNSALANRLAEHRKKLAAQVDEKNQRLQASIQSLMTSS